MMEKELKILKEHWKCPKAPSLDGESPICIEMLDTILEKLRKLDDEELVKELDKLSYEDRRKIAEPYVVDYDKEPEPTDFS